MTHTEHEASENTGESPVQAIQTIPAAIAEPVNELREIAGRLAGSELRSLVVYGAAATPHFNAKVHSIRSVLVLGSADLNTLRNIAQYGEQLGKRKLSAPLIMTPDYVRSSCDVFPIEMLEIKQAHILVAGTDLFSDLELAETDLRLQCERELKTLLIGMRQGLLAAAGRDEYLTDLETDIGDALIRILRAMALLKGHKEAIPAANVIELMEKEVDANLLGIREAIDPSGPHGWTEFKHLYADIEKLGEAVDGWN